MAIFTSHAADGGSFKAAQPVAGSVTGSPFTITTAAAVPTPALTGLVLLHSTQDVHIRISKAGTAATVSNILYPGGQIHLIPVDGEIISMLAAANGTAYVELAKELSV